MSVHIDSIENVDSVSKLLQIASSEYSEQATFTLLCLHASWTKRRFSCRANTLALVLIESFKSLGIQSIDLSLKVVMLQVDQSDEMLNFCISDESDLGLNQSYDSNKSNPDAVRNFHLNCPEELPCLMTLLYRPGKGYIKNHLKLDPKFLSNFLNAVNEICNTHKKQSDQWTEETMTSLSNISSNTMIHALEQQIEWVQIRQTIEQVLSNQIYSLHKRSHSITMTEFSLSKYNLPLRIFIAGDRSQVGKSSICLGLLSSLLQIFPASQLGYIKPATQCEKPQLVSTFCASHGIIAIPVGPLIYYRGFTRAFLNDETECTEELLQRVSNAVDEVAKDKSIVIIDGVGYPSVGSITGTDNASVALASGYPQENGKRLPPAVLLVGKSGVGDAVDSYNLNASYFRSRKIPVIGAIFNKLPISGYYSLENCKDAVSNYFRRNTNMLGGEQVYGFIPEIQHTTRSDESNESTEVMEPNIEESFMRTFIESFSKHVDVHEILIRASYLKETSSIEGNEPESSLFPSSKIARTDQHSIHESLTRPVSRIKLSRDKIESSAKKQGASAG